MTTKALFLALAGCAAPLVVQAAVPGFDISHYQANVDFKGAYAAGARFVLIKATEGMTYTDPKFSAHYTGATEAGLVRGGYHFAHPSEPAAAQVDHFVKHGGGWTADGRTLPGMLDLESGPDGECWGLAPAAMVAWIRAFSDGYKAATTRAPILYTSPSWWKSCTGDSHAFTDENPLMLAHYASAVGPIPGGWPFETIWQNSDAYKFGGDSDVFNGDEAALKKLASG